MLIVLKKDLHDLALIKVLDIFGLFETVFGNLLVNNVGILFQLKYSSNLSLQFVASYQQYTIVEPRLLNPVFYYSYLTVFSVVVPHLRNEKFVLLLELGMENVLIRHIRKRSADY